MVERENKGEREWWRERIRERENGGGREWWGERMVEGENKRIEWGGLLWIGVGTGIGFRRGENRKGDGAGNKEQK